MKDQAVNEILKIMERILTNVDFGMSERDCEEVYDFLTKGAANIEDEASRQKVINLAEGFKSMTELPDFE